MVAERDRVDAQRRRTSRAIFGGDAEAAGGVLAVHDHAVGLVLLAQAGKQRLEHPPPGAAHDVADEEELHAAACLPNR